ncbi:zinc finger and SCAN domain-containing protein 4-like, partial [Mesocricetus auratus]|uniref:Zinc finger and SCAN domain-containing protein 4-like n=1 Tax=Mesocricetus auratus TaxID=10036 RepID=A0ABM2WP18_MESAU
IHVSMHGEEGLFPGHMTLNEVINILKGMKSSTTSARTDLPIPLNILSPIHECQEVSQRSVVGQKPLLMPTFMDCGFSTGHKDSEDGYNNPMNLSKVNSRERSPGIEMDSISMIQTHRCLQTEEKDVSDVIPQDYRSSNQLTSMYHGFSQREDSFEVVPKEEVQQDIMVPAEQLQSEMITRPQQNEDCQNSERDYTCESHQERHNRVPKTYQCGECPRTFKYPSSLLSHQRRHKKERTFVCNTCHKDFYTKSDLNVHSVIHKGKKPFACNTCGQSFSHTTNLIAHERIHTGEKPYTCSLCNHSFRQSSTYHRHRRLCHKSE